ncbi:MAG: LysM peptidoglycan-binding domain-containing protein [Bacteriovoracaceae bacterium]|nr:LysM peptidoglycan-binding domain-containing protein [Bacteriovoracaceae bacterium]
MKKNELKVLSITTLAVASMSVFALSPEYTVKKGDTLSAIALKQLKGGSLYGINGRLKKLLLLNPSITDSNKIEPGVTLNLRATVADLSKSIEEAKNLTNTPKTTQDETKITQSAPVRKSFDFLLTDKKDQQDLVLKLGAGVAFNNLDLIDKQTKETDSLASKASLNASAEASYMINSKSKLKLDLGVKQLKLVASGTDRINSSSTTFMSGTIGGEYQALDSLVLGIKTGFEERAFATNKTLSTISIGKKLVSKIGGTTRLLLDENSKTASSIHLEYGLLGSTTLNELQIESGQEIIAGFELIRNQFNFNPYLNWSTQNTSLYDQDSLTLGLNVNYKF